MDAIELCYMPALELGEAIRAKKVSPVEVVDAVLARIERLNPTLNAYCTVTAAAARAAAKEAEAVVMRGDALGTLHGIPVSIKDLVATKGVRTTHGSKLYDQFIPDDDAPVVERLKRAGAIILGKTNTPEFGHKAITDNLLFGRSGDGVGTTGGGDRRGWIDPHSGELLCDLRAQTDAGAGRHGPNLWWSGDALAHGPDDTDGARCRSDAKLHGGGRPTRSKLPAGRGNRLSRWPRPGDSRATCGVEPGLGLCGRGPGRAANRRGSGETVYRSGLPGGRGPSRVCRPRRDLSGPFDR